MCSKGRKQVRSRGRVRGYTDEHPPVVYVPLVLGGAPHCGLATGAAIDGLKGCICLYVPSLSPGREGAKRPPI